MNFEDYRQRAPAKNYEWPGLAITVIGLFGLIGVFWFLGRHGAFLALSLIAIALGVATIVVSLLSVFYSFLGDTPLSKKLILGSVIALLGELATLGVGLFYMFIQWNSFYY